MFRLKLVGQYFTLFLYFFAVCFNPFVFAYDFVVECTGALELNRRTEELVYDLEGDPSQLFYVVGVYQKSFCITVVSHIIPEFSEFIYHPMQSLTATVPNEIYDNTGMFDHNIRPKVIKNATNRSLNHPNPFEESIFHSASEFNGFLVNQEKLDANDLNLEVLSQRSSFLSCRTLKILLIFFYHILCRIIKKKVDKGLHCS